MIDLGRLIELQKKCDTTFEYKDVDAFLDTTSIRSDYFRQLVINAPAMLEALTLVRNSDRFKAHGLKCGIFCEKDCLWGKLAALLGKE